MTGQERTIIVERLTWRGVEIEVGYEPEWMNPTALGSAHIEIRVIAPERAPLPVTETGYRSHFLGREIVEAAGGPAAFVQSWLDEAAQTRDWRRIEEKRRQLDLFKG